MSNNKYFYLVLILLSFLCSCQDEKDTEEYRTDKREVNLIVEYEDQSGLYIDHNAEIYIYYGIYSMDLSDFTYSTDGIFIPKNPNIKQNITPDIKTNINGKEDITLLLENTEKITILVESSYHSQKIITDSYSASATPIKATYIFKE